MATQRLRPAGQRRRLIAPWAQAFDRAWLRGDLVAGLTLGFVLIPRGWPVQASSGRRARPRSDPTGRITMSKSKRRAAAHDETATIAGMSDAPRLSVADRRGVGRAAREAVPRGSHAAWEPPADRFDPVAILEGQESTRVADLIPIRHGRMAASPFAFYRGAAAIMAADLARRP